MSYLTDLRSQVDTKASSKWKPSSNPVDLHTSQISAEKGQIFFGIQLDFLKACK
jgi:hypothetical protein